MNLHQERVAFKATLRKMTGQGNRLYAERRGRNLLGVWLHFKIINNIYVEHLMMCLQGIGFNRVYRELKKVTLCKELLQLNKAACVQIEAESSKKSCLCMNPSHHDSVTIILKQSIFTFAPLNMAVIVCRRLRANKNHLHWVSNKIHGGKSDLIQFQKDTAKIASSQSQIAFVSWASKGLRQVIGRFF